ncbi:MAG: ribonuclease III [Gammaproteobacteria bacterium]|nr:ribonuclease III [Gammaproteobacteria bacterium]MCW8987550.1 ribonuclease III [Gammaproteobacteria bacterium]MCW9031375.1 ribonuclease III [Gammaproteobacteria bacterium]
MFDYRFNDESLLLLALTHRSIGRNNNERLEFLGDSILGMVISCELYKRFPKEKEGVLTRLRSSLVKGETLSKIATELNLGEYIQLGSGELKSGGFRRASTLADVVEAIFGAIYLDSYKENGIAVIEKIILKIFTNRINRCEPSGILKDPKTRLQEFLQAKGLPLPHYSVISISGQEHQQTFKVSCTIEGYANHVNASGSSRRKAEQAAAEKALDQIIHE